MRRFDEEVFARKEVLRDALVPFGFAEQNGAYVYRAPVLDGAFEVRVTVDRRGAVSSLVWDTACEEEYIGVHTTQEGAFVAAVREAYHAVLEKVCTACFISKPFLTPQANRLTESIFKTFGESPDFPFSTAPGYGVFRCAQTRKWYGLIMQIKRALVTKESLPPEKNTVVEIINLKTGVEDHAAARALPGVYDAYHMKHDAWISVLLDDTLPDETILSLIVQSRAFAVPKTKTTRRS